MNSNDFIFIEGLTIHANHGVFDFEKEKGQTFIVDAGLYLDTQKAGLTDDLDASVNYALVCETIQKAMTEKSYNLIEKVAEEIAIAILDEYRLVEKVSIKISKPEAPVDMTFEDISVNITRSRHKAFVAYGSNMGDSTALIKSGLDELDKNPYCHILKKSTEMISAPYGGVEQANYHNGVIMLETYLEPYSLLSLLNEIEKNHGRERLVHWGPRTLDLDIILYDHLVLNTEKLTIPHIDMASRDFVLVPLAEIAPWYIHPVTGKSIQKMCDELKDKYLL